MIGLILTEGGPTAGETFSHDTIRRRATHEGYCDRRITCRRS
jgi:hypothetical protein